MNARLKPTAEGDLQRLLDELRGNHPFRLEAFANASDAQKSALSVYLLTDPIAAAWHFGIIADEYANWQIDYLTRDAWCDEHDLINPPLSLGGAIDRLREIWL